MLLGRQHELTHIEGLLTGAKDGTSAALLLHGEPGIGKSALLRAATEQAAELGFVVLRARGYESESDIPFAGLLELLTPLLALRDKIPEVQARALSSALALEPPTPFDRFAVPAGMLSLLAAAAEEQPFVEPGDRERLHAGLIAIDGSIEFFHPLLRSAIYHAADPVARRSVHATLARLPGGAPARRAWHLAAAADAPDEEVAAALEVAAGEARARGGVTAGARAFERAASLSTDDEARARRLLEAASDFAQGGLVDHALELVSTARELVPGGALATEVVRVRGRVEMRRGAPGIAHDLLATEANRIEADNPGAAASLLVEAAVAHMMTGDLEALVATGDRARALLPPGENPVIEVLATVLVGEAHAALGHEDEADELLDPALPFLTGEHVLAVPSELIGMAGQCAIWYERWDRAHAVLDHLVTTAREAAAINHLIYPLTAHSVLDFRRGRWGAALADAGEAERLARETGAKPLLTFALSVLAHVEAGMGRREDARAHAREAVRLGELLGGDAITTYGLNALAFDALGAGEVEIASEFYDRAARIAARLHTQRGVVQFGADRVEALARLGRTDEAFQALEEFADTPGGGHWALGALARCRGILAATGAEGHFQTALTHHQQDGQPFEKARTQLAYGERLRRDRRRGDAREQLSEALEAFERLGAAPWADRARVELRATGGAAAEGDAAEKSAVAAAGLEELTAHELQIARLVAYGMTNREVAAKLFLSPKTIEYHLSQIYRKLDLRSRTQLASLMAQEMPETRSAA